MIAIKGTCIACQSSEGRWRGAAYCCDDCFYKTCAVCGKKIRNGVSFSQYFHDECAPEEIKFGSKP